MRSASRAVASGSTRAGSWVVRARSPPGELAELAVEQLGALGVERGERLVEHEQLGVVQQRPAEREPLHHPTRERGDALGPRLPEPEPLEQHPDPLAPLRHAVEPPVELEVLERGQLAVDQRLVAEVAEPAALGVDVELAARRRGEPATSRSSVVFPEPFGPVTTRNPPRSSSKSSSRSTRRRRSASRAPGPDHAATSSRTKPKKTMLITPFTVKNAASRRRRSPGRTSECS